MVKKLAFWSSVQLVFYLDRTNEYFAIFAIINSDCIDVIQKVNVAVNAVFDHELFAFNASWSLYHSLLLQALKTVLTQVQLFLIPRIHFRFGIFTLQIDQSGLEPIPSGETTLNHSHFSVYTIGKLDTGMKKYYLSN